MTGIHHIVNLGSFWKLGLTRRRQHQQGHLHYDSEISRTMAMESLNCFQKKEHSSQHYVEDNSANRTGIRTRQNARRFLIQETFAKLRPRPGWFKTWLV